MVVIRLSRAGTNKRPFYHIVVCDSRAPNKGRLIEQIGYFNPIARGQAETIQLKTERVQHWVSLGAQMSDRVAQLYRDLLKANVSSTAETTTAE